MGGFFPAVAEERKVEGKDVLEEELEEPGEDDFPDLVEKDDESELMDEFALLQEEDIVFSAAKHQQYIADSPSAVTVITREQIENTHCTEIICLLRQVPEVEVRDVVPFYTAVGTRALSGELGDKMLLVLDGRAINTEVFGMPWWQNLPVTLEDIERIEVIRGPGSALYGANAYTGVVSITSREPGDDLATLVLGAGEHDRASLHLRIGQRLGNWSLGVSGGYDTAGNWQVQGLREREVGRVRLELSRVTQESSSRLWAALNFSQGPIYTTLGAMPVKDTTLGHLMLSHHRDLVGAQLSVVIMDGDAFTQVPLVYRGIKLGELPKSLHIFSSDLYGEVQFNWSPFEGNLLVSGASGQWMAFLIEKNLEEQVFQYRAGVFVQDEQRIGTGLLLTAGLRFDYNSLTPSSFSPRLACVWQFASQQYLRAASGMAFRKPAFMHTSLHITGVRAQPGFEGLDDFFARSIGNDDLGNENLTAFEIGYRGRFLERRLTVEADVFLNLYRDTINFHVLIATNEMGLPSLADSEMFYRNTGREVNSLGGSLSVTYQPSDEWRLSANYTYRHSWYIADTDEPEVAGEGGKGTRVPWEPAQLFHLSLHRLFQNGLRLGVALSGATSFQDVRPREGGFFNENVVLRIPTHASISGFAAWRVAMEPGWLEVGVRAFNAFNAPFRDSTAVSRPDGTEVGGELIGREIFLFLRGNV
jgi:outer membrane cobalamin receptor